MAEGFGTRLAAIAQTFRITGRPVEQARTQQELLNIAAGEELPYMSTDAQEAFRVTKEFFDASCGCILKKNPL